mgnify:CR=1 FL=1
MTLADLELDRLQISFFRPRHLPRPWFTATELARAAELVEPVIARLIPDTQPPNYSILTGLKHWLMAQRLLRATMPVLVRTVSDAMSRRWVEADAATTRLDPLAEARALHQRVAQGLSVAAAGRGFGLSRTDVSRRPRLLRLTPEVREQVVRGELPRSGASPGRPRKVSATGNGRVHPPRAINHPPGRSADQGLENRPD